MRIKTRLDLALSAGFAVVLLVAVMSLIGAAGLVDTIDKVERSRTVDTRLDRVLEDLIDIETGTRGYVLTGVDSFLAPYDRASHALPADLLALRKAIAATGATPERDDQLELLVTPKLAHAAEIVEKRRTEGLLPAAAMVGESQGKMLMDDARRLIGEMDSAEEVQLRIYTARERTRARRTLMLVLVSTVGMGLVVLLGVLMVRRSLTTPLAALAVAARRAGRGEWDTSLEQRNDEFGDLERAFAEMVEARRAAELHARQLVDDAPEPFFLANLEGQFTDVNRAACQLLDYSRDELLDKSINDLIPAEDVPRLAAENTKLRVPGAVHVGEWHLRARSGQLIPVEVSSKIFPDGRWQAFVRDLRDRKLLEEERQNALLAREGLIAVVSHDLKNPLNAIQLRNRLIERNLGDPKALEHCASVRRSVDTMQRMIRGLLDSASLEAGRLRLELEDHDLGEIVDEVLDVLAPVAGDAGIELRGRVERGKRIRFDRDRIAQVLYNLIGNALKFTPSGGTVTVKAEYRVDDVLVSVIDTGAGIASEALPRIFDRFFTSGGRVGGTGLGLEIAKGLVESHGGTIWASSTQGDGSTFSFTLPMSGAAIVRHAAPQHVPNT